MRLLTLPAALTWASLSSVLAQNVVVPTPLDFAASFYSLPGCSGAESSILAQQTFCQRGVSPTSGGYSVTCNSTEAGVVRFFAPSDPACAGTPQLSRSFLSGECLVGEGASPSLRFTCLPTANTPAPPLDCNRCSLTSYEFVGCAGPDRAVVNVPANTCHPGVGGSGSFLIIPSNANNGDAIVSFCTDASCGNCPIRTPFNSGQCRETSPDTGSRSITAKCGVCVSPSPTPSSTATATATATATSTRSAAPSPTSTSTATATSTRSAAPSPSSTATSTRSAAPSPSPSPSPSSSSSSSPSASASASYAPAYPPPSYPAYTPPSYPAYTPPAAYDTATAEEVAHPTITVVDESHEDTEAAPKGYLRDQTRPKKPARRSGDYGHVVLGGQVFRIRDPREYMDSGRDGWDVLEDARYEHLWEGRGMGW
jgi:hypothetical protein